MMCERCWAEAFQAAMYDPSLDQADHYIRITSTQNASGHVCSSREQAGSYWDEARQIDTRKTDMQKLEEEK